jgi:cob(I)alamin adenosyltransferase
MVAGSAYPSKRDGPLGAINGALSSSGVPQNGGMPRLTRIYTKTGDQGMTGLGGGKRVPKDSPRVAAYGTVDELNSQLGVALASGLSDRLATELALVQNELFDLGADLATPADSQARHPVPTVQARHIERLESLIDELNEIVGPLANFLLPGGSAGAAHLHVARTICRRAERVTTTLARDEPIGPTVLPYLNRLSDALFVMARYENHVAGVSEPLWDPGR